MAAMCVLQECPRRLSGEARVIELELVDRTETNTLRELRHEDESGHLAGSSTC